MLICLSVNVFQSSQRAFASSYFFQKSDWSVLKVMEHSSHGTFLISRYCQWPISRMDMWNISHRYVKHYTRTLNAGYWFKICDRTIKKKHTNYAHPQLVAPNRGDQAYFISCTRVRVIKHFCFVLSLNVPSIRRTHLLASGWDAPGVKRQQTTSLLLLNNGTVFLPPGLHSGWAKSEVLL